MLIRAMIRRLELMVREALEQSFGTGE